MVSMVRRLCLGDIAAVEANAVRVNESIMAPAKAAFNLRRLDGVWSAILVLKLVMSWMGTLLVQIRTYLSVAMGIVL